jgi:predicted DCC family thiol-disulfide oxidoreductase YuxK
VVSSVDLQVWINTYENTIFSEVWIFGYWYGELPIYGYWSINKYILFTSINPSYDLMCSLQVIQVIRQLRFTSRLVPTRYRIAGTTWRAVFFECFAMDEYWWIQNDDLGSLKT